MNQHQTMKAPTAEAAKRSIERLVRYATENGMIGPLDESYARNELLDDGYDPAAPDPGFRRLVGRASAGVAWSNDCGAVSFAVAVDSREFDRQRRAHGFGTLAVHWDF